MRDTDGDWAAIGASEPYFGVLSAPEFLSTNLDDAARARFFASGDGDIAYIVGVIERMWPGFRPARAVDFGCGVGRLVLAMARIAGHVSGVDIAPAMLAEAARNAAAAGVTNVDFSADLPDGPLDWINSHIVFQHIPPDQGFAVMERLLARLASGGIASIEVAAYRTIDHLSPTIHDIDLCRYDGRTLDVLATRQAGEVGQMRMYDYDMTRILASFARAGIHTTLCEHLDQNGHHAFRVFGRKD